MNSVHQVAARAPLNMIVQSVWWKSRATCHFTFFCIPNVQLQRSRTPVLFSHADVCKPKVFKELHPLEDSTRDGQPGTSRALCLFREKNRQAARRPHVLNNPLAIFFGGNSMDQKQRKYDQLHNDGYCCCCLMFVNFQIQSSKTV